MITGKTFVVVEIGGECEERISVPLAMHIVEPVRLTVMDDLSDGHLPAPGRAGSLS